MALCFIAFGSNQQDPIAQLCQARQALRAESALQEQSASSLYQSPAWGYEAQPDFVNAVVAYRTDLSAEALLDLLQAQEQRQGRVRYFINAPRTLDLDLLAYDDVCLNSERLHLPHPRLWERAFVVYPLREIAPELVLCGRPIATLNPPNNLTLLSESW